MRKHTGLFLFLLFLLLLFLSQITIAQNPQVSSGVISSGGGRASGTSNILISTVGEAFIGVSESSVNKSYSGFWYIYKQSTVTSADQDEIVPTVFKLEQNYPNPFNPSTTIKFGVPERSRVLIIIYDLLGSELLTLVDQEMEAGWYKKEFKASGYSSGMYICRMKAGSFTSTKKMILLK